MQKVVTHLWLTEGAAEAAELYTSTFQNSRIVSSTSLDDKNAEGNVDIFRLDIEGFRIWLLNAEGSPGLNPSFSFKVYCESAEEVDAIWAKLSEGGAALMELGEYPFAKYFGWTQDRFGLSWQIIYMEGEAFEQKIVPTFLFVGDVCGKAEEAMKLYTSTMSDSSIGEIQRYPADQAPSGENSVMVGHFQLSGIQYDTQDAAPDAPFGFNKAAALAVFCETQAEIDTYWEALSAFPEKEQSGWLVDKFGISWIIVPTLMDTMTAKNDTDKIARVNEALMKMKKLDKAELEKAYRGN